MLFVPLELKAAPEDASRHCLAGVMVDGSALGPSFYLKNNVAPILARCERGTSLGTQRLNDLAGQGPRQDRHIEFTGCVQRSLGCCDVVGVPHNSSEIESEESVNSVLPRQGLNSHSKIVSVVVS